MKAYCMYLEQVNENQNTTSNRGEWYFDTYEEAFSAFREIDLHNEFRTIHNTEICSHIEESYLYLALGELTEDEWGSTYLDPLNITNEKSWNFDEYEAHEDEARECIEAAAEHARR